MGQINDCKFNAMGGGGTPPEPAVVFHAATYDPDTYEMHLQSVGEGVPTSTHTATIYAADHEGVYREFGADEPVWEGGRFAYANIGVDKYNDVIDGGLNVTVTPITDGYNVANSDGSASVSSNWIGFGVTSLSTGNTVKVVFTATINSGSLTITHYWNGTDYAENPYGAHLVTDGLNELIVPGKPSGSERESLSHSNYQNYNINLTNISIYITEEKVFADDGTGTLLDTLPMLKYQGAGTNAVTHSRNLSLWPVITQTPVFAQELTDISGVPSNAWTIEDTDNAAAVRIRDTFPIPVDIVSHTLKFFLYKDGSTSSFPEIQLKLSANGTGDGLATQFNKVTGAFVNRSDVGTNRVVVLDKGDKFLILMETTGNGSADISVQIYPAAGTTLGVYTTTAVGKVGLDGIEINIGKTIEEVQDVGPIFTNGTAVSTDEIITTWAAANHSDDGDSYEADYKLTGEDQVLLSMGGTVVLSVVSGDVVLSDGTNSCSTPIVSAEPHIIATYNRVLGDELIANGDFSNGTTGWEAYANGSVIDAIGEQINCETTFEDRGFYQQIPGLIRDKEYIMSVDVLTVTTDNLRISLGSGIGNLTSGLIDITTPGHYEHTFTPIGDGDLFLSFSHGTTGDTSVDNVSFKEESAAESNMQLDVDGVKSAEVHYNGTLGSGDLSTQATQRDLIRRVS